MVDYGVQYYEKYSKDGNPPHEYKYAANARATFVDLLKGIEIAFVREWSHEGGELLDTRQYVNIHSITLFDPAQEANRQAVWDECKVIEYDDDREADVCYRLRLVEGNVGAESEVNASKISTGSSMRS